MFVALGHPFARIQWAFAALQHNVQALQPISHIDQKSLLTACHDGLVLKMLAQSVLQTGPVIHRSG